jgi:hypothetical protein
MNVPGITWRGQSPDDIEIMRELPPELVSVLAELNGFIVHYGALHVRGASLKPEWHSLRSAWRGPQAFHVLYGALLSSDIPFAQDQLGDQFLMRGGQIYRLGAETGEVSSFCESLSAFLDGLAGDVETFLNVSFEHTLQPGELLHAYPPFCVKGDSIATSLFPCPAPEVILVHAGLAKEIAELPDVTRIQIRPPKRRTKRIQRTPR